MNSLSDILATNHKQFLPDEPAGEEETTIDAPELTEWSSDIPPALPSMSQFAAPPVAPPLPDPEQDETNGQSELAAETETSPASPSLDISALIQTIHAMKDQLDGMLRMLKQTRPHDSRPSHTEQAEVTQLHTGEQVIEGVFNGKDMIGPDGKQYTVPPNYASKSKLVEGDIMKLTITHGGKFIYKQIQQIPQKHIIGELVAAEQGQWTVFAEGSSYNVLTASVTFHKGSPGDDVVILVPKHGPASWGAVDNIIRK